MLPARVELGVGAEGRLVNTLMPLGNVLLVSRALRRLFLAL